MAPRRRTREDLERQWTAMARLVKGTEHYAGFGVCAGCGATDRYRRGKGPDSMKCRECFTTP